MCWLGGGGSWRPGHRAPHGRWAQVILYGVRDSILSAIVYGILGESLDIESLDKIWKHHDDNDPNDWPQALVFHTYT